MDQTNRCSTPTKTKTVLQHLFVLPNTYYESMELEEIHISAKWHPSSRYNIDLCIVQALDLVKEWNTPTAVAPQPRPR
jgi:hypothetical protein